MMTNAQVALQAAVESFPAGTYGKDDTQVLHRASTYLAWLEENDKKSGEESPS